MTDVLLLTRCLQMRYTLYVKTLDPDKLILISIICLPHIIVLFDSMWILGISLCIRRDELISCCSIYFANDMCSYIQFYTKQRVDAP